MNMTVTVLRTSPVVAETGVSAFPQLEQKRASSEFSRPHREQAITGRVYSDEFDAIGRSSELLGIFDS